MKRLLKNLPAIFVLATIFSTVVSPALALPSAFIASFIPSSGNYVAQSGLNVEVWIQELKEGFYADDSWLAELRDLSAFVDADIINLAEAGASPDILINNTAYPIATSDRADTPLTIEMDYYDTENQRVRNADKAELVYNKLASIVYGHKQALRMKIMESGAHEIAPATNTAFTPLLTATGADNGSGLKRLKWADLRRLQLAYDEAEIAPEGRVIILSQQHLSDLETEDLDRFNKVMDKGEICGFKMYRLAAKRLPRYNKTTGAKVAFGAAAAGTDSTASICFHKDEVGRAIGSESMFHKEAKINTEGRADEIGFQIRAKITSIRNKGVGAIYSPAA